MRKMSICFLKVHGIFSSEKNVVDKVRRHETLEIRISNFGQSLALLLRSSSIFHQIIH